MLSHVAAAADICAAHNDADGSSGQPRGPDNDCPCGPACTMDACDAPVGVTATSSTTIAWPAIPGATLQTTALAQLAVMHAACGSNLPRAPPLA
jgi:hypothetical protein